MAAFFEIMILTGADLGDARMMTDHLSSLSTLHEGPLARHVAGPEGWWWVRLLPKGVGFGVPYDRGYFIESHAECVSIVAEIYERLKTAPSFVCVLAGWEVEDQLFDLADAEYVWEHEIVRFNAMFVDGPGAIIPDDWWKEMKGLEEYDSDSFEPFRDGFVWSPDLGFPLKAYGRT